MATEIYVRFIVEDGDVGKATKKIQKLGHEAEVVTKKVQKTGNELGDAFDTAQESASNLQGGVEGIATEFVNVGKAAKKGGAAMRSALISTGIGALIVALGFVVTHWEDILELTGLVNKDIERQNELLSIQAGVADAELSYLKSKLDLYKSQGRSIEEIDKLEQQIAERRFARQTELEQQINVANDLYKKLLSEGDVQAAAEQKIAVLALLRERNRLQKEIDDASTITLTGKGKEKPKKQGRRKKEQTLDVSTAEELKAEREQRQKFFEELFKIDELNKLKEVDLLKDVNYQKKVENAELTEDERKNAKAREKIAGEEFNNKQKLLGSTADALQAFSKIAGEETGAGKALAVAASLINTYASIAGQLKAFSGVPIPGYAIAQAIATGAVGFASVKDILKVKVPKGGGGGGQGVGATPQGSTPPAFNVVGTSGVNQIAQTLGQDQNPIQAYVVGSNVTSQQALDRNIVETATIG